MGPGTKGTKTGGSKSVSHHLKQSSIHHFNCNAHKCSLIHRPISEGMDANIFLSN